MKNNQEIYLSLKENLENKIKAGIREGSLIDINNHVISDEISDMYTEIENSKNPHLYTNLFGKDLDDFSYLMNLTRMEGESDETFKLRLSKWATASEASNTTAIENAILNLKYASNVEYISKTHGIGTGSCYIIPKVYEEDTINKALEETQERLKNIIDPSMHIEYIVPTIRAVKLHLYISISGDEIIKDNVTKKIKKYINSIAPGEYLKAGEIINIGINEPGVEYFNVIAIYVDEEKIQDIEIVQELDSKFLFDEIIWSGAQ